MRGANKTSEGSVSTGGESPGLRSFRPDANLSHTLKINAPPPFLTRNPLSLSLSLFRYFSMTITETWQGRRSGLSHLGGTY